MMEKIGRPRALFMRAALSAAIFLALAASSRARAGGDCGEGELNKAGKCEKLFRATIHPGFPETAFRVVWPPGPFVELGVIEVVRPNKKHIQALTVDESAAPFLDFEAVDFNFDGYKDIRFLVNAGATGNTSSMVWFFDADKDKYVPRPEFLDYSNPTPDPKTKTVSTWAKGGMAGLIYFSDSYRYGPDGGLVPAESEGQDYLGEYYFYWHVAERKDGEMRLSKDAVYRFPDLGGKQTVCGPGKPGDFCAPLVPVISLALAEADKSPESMVANYRDVVIWNGKTMKKSELAGIHSKYLSGTLDGYHIEMSDFKREMADDGKRAAVTCVQKGGYADGKGQRRGFHLKKRYRTVFSDGRWLIDCEETAASLDGQKTRITNACVISGTQP